MYADVAYESHCICCPAARWCQRRGCFIAKWSFPIVGLGAKILHWLDCMTYLGTQFTVFAAEDWSVGLSTKSCSNWFFDAYHSDLWDTGIQVISSDNYVYINTRIIYLYILCSCTVGGKKRREGKKAKLSTASYNLAQQLRSFSAETAESPLQRHFWSGSAEHWFFETKNLIQLWWTVPRRTPFACRSSIFAAISRQAPKCTGNLPCAAQCASPEWLIRLKTRCDSTATGSKESHNQPSDTFRATFW